MFLSGTSLVAMELRALIYLAGPLLVYGKFRSNYVTLPILTRPYNFNK